MVIIFSVSYLYFVEVDKKSDPEVLVTMMLRLLLFSADRDSEIVKVAQILLLLEIDPTCLEFQVFQWWHFSVV